MSGQQEGTLRERDRDAWRALRQIRAGRRAEKREVAKENGHKLGRIRGGGAPRECKTCGMTAALCAHRPCIALRGPGVKAALAGGAA